MRCFAGLMTGMMVVGLTVAGLAQGDARQGRPGGAPGRGPQGPPITTLAGDVQNDLDRTRELFINMVNAMDKIVCPMLLLKIGGPPNGPGVIIGGSTTVQINGLPAGRATDQIREVLALDPNMVAVGFPTVQIGG